MDEVFETQENQSFQIDSDEKADWAVGKIAEEARERDRIISLAKQKIEHYTSVINDANARYDARTAFLRNSLLDYMGHVRTKETLSKRSYRLLSGTLVWKKEKQTMEPDREALVKRLAGTEYVKTKTDVDWAAYKKRLIFAGDLVIDSETGEVVEEVKVETKPGEFVVEVNADADV